MAPAPGKGKKPKPTDGTPGPKAVTDLAKL
jgi:hypothetical protein